MDEDAVPDFSSRRAMFQKMSQDASVPQPSHQAAILKGHTFATLGDADQKRKSYARATSTESYTLGKPVRMSKPFALPRAKFDGVVQVNKNEEPKFNTLPLSLVDSVPALVDSQNHKLTGSIGMEHESNGNKSETAMDKQHFRHTLQLWEKSSSHSTLPRQLSQTSNTAQDGGLQQTLSDESDALLECSPPRWTTEYQEAGPYRYQDDKSISEDQRPAFHSIKPLPPLELLGPRPRKPERPPLVDLSAFLRSGIPRDNAGAADHGCQCPELAEPYQDGDTYEDVLAVRAEFDSMDVAPATGNENSEYVSLMSDKEVDSLNSKNNQNGGTEDVYYDVECVNGGLNRLESSTFTSDSFSETSNEVYDDVQNVIKDDNCSNKSEKDVKLKGLGRIFKKNKGKVIQKIPKSKEHGIIKAASVPNLKAEDPDLNSGTFYSNVENGTEPNAVKKVEDKQKSRLSRFLLLKEGKEKRRSHEWVESEEGMYADVQTQGPRGILKSKGKKMAKEEKHFREKFEYTKDIEVINTAVVESSAKTAKLGKLDLPVKAGEELDIIDITDENLVICRNSGGKYGYVLVEHLNFKS